MSVSMQLNKHLKGKSSVTHCSVSPTSNGQPRTANITILLLPDENTVEDLLITFSFQVLLCPLFPVSLGKGCYLTQQQLFFKSCKSSADQYAWR